MKYYTGIGSRKTPDDIGKLMIEIASSLREKGYTLRSGGAAGADSFFEEGAGFEENLKEIYLPWKNFNGNKSSLYNTPKEAYTIARQFHPFWDELSFGAKALHARNVCQVLGYDLKTPSEFVICWTMAGTNGGGTGQAIRVATHYGVPVFNLFNSIDIKQFL